MPQIKKKSSSHTDINDDINLVRKNLTSREETVFYDLFFVKAAHSSFPFPSKTRKTSKQQTRNYVFQLPFNRFYYLLNWCKTSSTCYMKRRF